jgi:hypothetical protein
VSIMDSIGSFALFGGVVFLGAFVSGLCALRKDIQTEGEHRGISELAIMTLYRHSE